MARQISSHRGVGDESIAPQDVHGDLSSNNSNVSAGNLLISSGLKIGTIIFKDKYIVDMEKFTTVHQRYFIEVPYYCVERRRK